jgi:hypothetical protein
MERSAWRHVVGRMLVLVSLLIENFFMPPLSRPILFGALLLSALSHPALAADLISSNDWPMADAQAQIVGMMVPAGFMI